MLKLSELRGSARLRADTSRISRKSSLGPALLFAAGTLCASSFGASAAPVVATQEGVVQGVIDKGVAEFLGVPYAEPPIGNLRWKPSKKHEAWAGVLKATAFGPTCEQVVTLGSVVSAASVVADEAAELVESGQSIHKRAKTHSLHDARDLQAPSLHHALPTLR